MAPTEAEAHNMKCEDASNNCDQNAENVEINCEPIEDEESQEMDKLSLTGKYHNGKSASIVKKYYLKGPSDKAREGLIRMLRDLKNELSLTDEKLLKLQKLKIKLPKLSSRHKVKKLWLYQKDAQNMKKYTKYEKSVILSNWKKFRKTYRFEKKDASLFLPHTYWLENEKFKKRKIQFAQFLAQGLPDRTVKSVYFKFVELMQTDERPEGRRYTLLDDFLIRLVHQNFPRHSISILKHLLHLPNRVIMRRIKWNKAKFGLAKRLNEVPLSKVKLNQASQQSSSSSSFPRKYDGCKLWSIVTLALSRVLRELNHRLEVEAATSLHYPAWTQIDEVWSRLSDETSIPKLALKKIVFTRLLPMAVDYGKIGRKCNRVKHFALKIAMLEKLFQERRCTWEKVDWVEVSDSVGGVGPVFIYSLFRKAVKKFVPADLWHSFELTIEYMHKNVLPVYRKASVSDVLYLRLIPQFHEIVTPSCETRAKGKYGRIQISDSESE